MKARQRVLCWLVASIWALYAFGSFAQDFRSGVPDASADQRLFEAVQDGSTLDVRNAINRGGSLAATDLFDLTPLMWAAARGDVGIVELLLSSGADPNQQNRFGWTALMSAALAKRSSAIELLLRHGAKAELRNTDGISARDIAIRLGFKEAAALMIK